VITVAITSAPGSPMASLCDHVIGCYFISNKHLGDIYLSLACSYVFGDMVFGLSCKYVFDVLFVMLFSDDVASNRRLTDEYHRLYTTGIGSTLAEETDTTARVLPGVGFIGRDNVPN
jgi:fructoselysine-6-P-deglycase FrlB-like protein